ncbi:MAG: hypothetical protein KA184_17320 [Candidatus Hydrogenedentes bacterium]|nr:hypothetical protein [Candidatus Hydrogenedentota bacterium]
MFNPELQQRFQLALSYREKARRLCESLEETYQTGGVAPSRYETEHAVYSDHLAVAGRTVEDLRLDELPQLTALGKKLQKLLRARQALEARSSGYWAARRLRALDQRIQRCREAVSVYNTLISAEDPRDIGGFVDLPVDRYRVEAPRQPAEFSLTESNLKLIGLAFVLLVVSVIVTFVALRPASGLNVTAARLVGAADVVVLECANAGGVPVMLHVPWGESRRHASSAAYGVDVYVRESGTGEFRLWADSTSVWYYEARSMRFQDMVEVPPRLRAELRLDLSQLRRMQPSAEAAKVVVSTHDGAPVFTAVFEM